MKICQEGDNLKNLFLKLKKKPDFAFIDQLVQKFPKSEIYLVGGAVRDIVLGLKEVRDYDFVVRGVSSQKLEMFLNILGRVDLVGKNFGVFKFKPKIKGQNNLIKEIDIALPRTEHSLNFRGGYRDFKVQANPELSIAEDLNRRDFTINALAWNLNKNKLIDPTGGEKDLAKKIIRTVGKPEERFREDYSRMLRALRFSSQLNFKIEAKTFEALKKLMLHLNDEREIRNKKERVVANEIIGKEFLKAFYHNPVEAFDLYDESGAFRILVPELLKMKDCPQPTNWHSEGDVWEHTRLALKLFSSKKFEKQFLKEFFNTELIMAVLFHDVGKPPTIKTPEKDGTDRIRFNEHDQIGAKITKKVGRRLKWSAAGEFSCQPKEVSWLVNKHLFLVHGRIKEIRNNTLEKYFFNPEVPGKNLLKLFFLDAQATIPETGKPDLTNFNQLRDRLRKLEKFGKAKGLPKSLINGEEIMKELNLKPGPKIGELLQLVREEQLTGRVRNKKAALLLIAGLLRDKIPGGQE